MYMWKICMGIKRTFLTLRLINWFDMSNWFVDDEGSVLKQEYVYIIEMEVN